MGIRTIVVVSLALSAWSAGLARAQNAEAQSLFDQGLQQMSEGKLDEACHSFAASNDLEQRAGTLMQLGNCYEQQHKVASAWSAYKDALNRAKDERKRELAQAKVDELEPKLSYLTISIAGDAQLEGLSITRNGKPFIASLWNRPLPVDGGSYTIVANAPGHAEWKATTSVPAESGKITVAVPKLDVPTASAPLSTASIPATNEAPRSDRDAPAGSWLTPRRKLALSAGAVAVVAAGTGLVLGIQAQHRRDDAYALCPNPTQACANADAANALISQNHDRATEADIAFAVAGAAAIAGGVLWFLGAPQASDHVAVTPVLRAHASGLAITGRF